MRHDYILDGASLSVGVAKSNTGNIRAIVRLFRYILKQGKDGATRVALEKNGRKTLVRFDVRNDMDRRRMIKVVKVYKNGGVERAEDVLKSLAYLEGSAGRPAMGRGLVIQARRCDETGRAGVPLFELSLVYSVSDHYEEDDRIYLNLRSSPTLSAIGVNHLSAKSKNRKNRVKALMRIPFCVLEQVCDLKVDEEDILFKSVQLAFNSSDFESVDYRNLALEQFVSSYTNRVVADRNIGACAAHILGLGVRNNYGESGRTVGVAIVKEKYNKPYLMLGVYGKDLKEDYLLEKKAISMVEADPEWVREYSTVMKYDVGKAEKMWEDRLHRCKKRLSRRLTSEDVDTVSRCLRFDLTLYAKYVADELNVPVDGLKLVDFYRWVGGVKPTEVARSLIRDVFKVDLMFGQVFEDVSTPALLKRVKMRMETYYPGFYSEYVKWLGNSSYVSGQRKMASYKLAENYGIEKAEWYKFVRSVKEDYGWDMNLPIRALKIKQKICTDMLLGVDAEPDLPENDNDDSMKEYEEELSKYRELRREAMRESLDISKRLINSLKLQPVRTREIGDYYLGTE